MFGRIGIRVVKNDRVWLLVMLMVANDLILMAEGADDLKVSELLLS